MIRLSTLGVLDLQGAEGQELRTVLAQPKRAALLAYLAIALPRGLHRRDPLLALFWPEYDAERARNALSQEIHFLRRSLGDAVFVRPSGEEIGLDRTAFWCDAVAFEAALDAGKVAEALALYRGDLLDGFFISDAPEFERWLETERERLRLHYLAMSTAVVADTGVHEAAVDLPFRLVESLVNMWTKQTGPDRSALPEHVADACIRVLGMPDTTMPALRARTELELARYDAARAG